MGTFTMGIRISSKYTVIVYITRCPLVFVDESYSTLTFDESALHYYHDIVLIEMTP